MLIVYFYILFIIYTFLFGWLFNLDFNSFNDPLFYVLGVLTLLISYILSFVSVLATLSISGEFRKGKPFDNMWNHRFANAFLRFAAHIGRIKVTTTGLENIPEGNDFVLVANHQENYDIIVLMPIFKNHPLIFIAKEPLFKVPVIGKWIGLLGNIPIGRMADREAAKSIIKGIKRHKSGLPVAIFPEGKRSRSNEMIEWKPGALKLAMKPKADILVATLYDLPTIFKSFPWKRYEIKVHIHPIIKYEEYKDINTTQLAEQIKSTIQKKINEFEEAKR